MTDNEVGMDSRATGDLSSPAQGCLRRAGVADDTVGEMHGLNVSDHMRRAVAARRVAEIDGVPVEADAAGLPVEAQHRPVVRHRDGNPAIGDRCRVRGCARRQGSESSRDHRSGHGENC